MTQPDDTGDLLAEIQRISDELKARGPILGAIIVCDWWQKGGLCFKVLPGEIEDWSALEDFIGDEGVEFAKREEGRIVFICGGRDFDERFPVSPTQDPSAMFFGPRIYRLREPPLPKLRFDTDFPWRPTDWTPLRIPFRNVP